MKHDKIERNLGIMLVLTMLAISVGGLVEIVPLFFIKDTVETVKTADGKEMVRPYTPLEQRGRDIYIREGCYLCHSQMIRPFRDEMLRYGHYSLAAESKYDHPFQWGSKRTGPDLARVGGKYSNDWHVQHLVAPRSMVPESVMPNYPWLMQPLQYADIQKEIEAYLEYDPETFKGKVVYCNCDDPYESNFFRYFVLNFKKLGLKHIHELSRHFNSVIDWVSTVFSSVEKEMQGLEWGRLYTSHHHQPYSPDTVAQAVMQLYGDPSVKNPDLQQSGVA